MGPYTLIRKLERHGVGETQLDAALGEVDPEEVREIFEGDVPLRKALADSAAAERSDQRRYYAYLVLAAAPGPELARRVGAEGYLRRRRASVERQVRRGAREGVTDGQLQGAITAIGARPVAEALAGSTPFGRWAREAARSAPRRRERVAYARLAATGPRRVRAAIMAARSVRAGGADEPQARGRDREDAPERPEPAVALGGGV